MGKLHKLHFSNTEMETQNVQTEKGQLVGSWVRTIFHSLV